VFTKVSEQCMASINFNSEAEGIIFLQNTSAHLQVYMMSQTRRQHQFIQESVEVLSSKNGKSIFAGTLNNFILYY